MRKKLFCAKKVTTLPALTVRESASTFIALNSNISPGLYIYEKVTDYLGVHEAAYSGAQLHQELWFLQW
jgi:hypothetical protein